MAREFKFRAWDWKNKKFVSGYEAYENSACGWQNDDTGSHIILREVQYIITQFTGLIDQNGKEIYEGDILRVKDAGFLFTYIGVINWDTERLAYSVAILKEYPTMSAGKRPVSFLIRDHVFEVVGNIYKDPELLKENK